MTYQQALSEAEETGLSQCSDAAAMAAFCKAEIQIFCGAVSPRLVWEGAQKKGLTFQELAELANDNPSKVNELMWL